jgi:hypothetical protein
MAAILDRQTGKRYAQVQFVNEIVDFFRSAEGRQPCYDLLDHKVDAIDLSDGRSFEWVAGESDAERFDREFRGA